LCSLAQHANQLPKVLPDPFCVYGFDQGSSQRGTVTQAKDIQWTNKSVLHLAKGEDPMAVVERKARDLALRAKDAGWQGPPFNPIAIADLLGVPVEATADVADARTISTPNGLLIEFNPTQARERVRFSIAHELAHILFPDVADQIRHRGGDSTASDDWQLELLCNLAASEFVMPIGSLSVREQVPPIEELMLERRRFDVSAEAFLIRVAKTASEPIAMFCASPTSSASNRDYRIDYAVSSSSAPRLRIAGRLIPHKSVVYSCTAIGYTDRANEDWLLQPQLKVECGGIPGYPGNSYPRVAGLIHFVADHDIAEDIRFVHGNVLDPRGGDTKVICQLVNDQARTWGGGVARSAAKKYPIAQRNFSNWISRIPRAERLGKVHFTQVKTSTYVASLVAQQGYGASAAPRIRYMALERCFESVAEFARLNQASVHMPRIGTGQSGGQWDTINELVRTILVDGDLSVTVYDLPPRRLQPQAGLFD
jgi:Zn-dependent peptidase ImmA (M78 family)/O-acetyl-ADP-ribose deacetylase (regulator of RNase III)